MTMTAVTLDAYVAPSLPYRMGGGLPAPVRTAGALAALLLAVAVTGVMLVAFAVAMPFALLAGLVLRRLQPSSERRGWRPAPA